MSTFLYSVAALLGTGLFLWQIVKRYYLWIIEDFVSMKALIQLLRKVFHYEDADIHLCTKFAENGRKFSHDKFIVFENKKYTYLEVDEWSNRCARAFRKLGLHSGNTVGLMMMNEPAFIAMWVGCNKTGMAASFLNYNLRQKSLLHCIDVSDIKTLIVGKDEELLQAVLQISDELKERNIKVLVYGSSTSNYESFETIVEKQSFEDCPFGWRKDVAFNDPICYIFTSGTTGLPKAVKVDNYKCWSGAGIMSLCGIQRNDVIYTAMPLYHSAASLLGVAGAVDAGCTIVLRKKFSASQFLSDCRKYKVTIAQYVGETLRYVCKQPETSDDKDHKIRVVVGNGLRPDVWKVFLERYGSHIHVLEFYAATEGNVGFFNFHNHFGCIGTFSPLLQKLSSAAVVKYDYDKEEMIRGPDGKAVRVGYDEPGLLVGKITKQFRMSSYKGKESLTEKKILHDVFKKGDRYFNSGDLMKIDRNYRISFCDRIGDTFRWKGENVSTSEVGDNIAQAPGVKEANVYGVQIPVFWVLGMQILLTDCLASGLSFSSGTSLGKDGRAGMAAIVSEKSLDLAVLYEYLCKCLPSYARPLFLRLQAEMEITGTLKQRKVNLKRDGYKLENAAGDQIYFMDIMQSTYVPLTKKLQDDIESGVVRL